MIANLARKLLDALRRKLDIQSPSRAYVDWQKKPREYVEPIEYVRRWYDPHYPWEQWGDAAMKRRARIVRRALRRNA